MSMVDWNGDGNTDWQDSAMDYMVYKNTVGGGGSGSGRGGDSCLSAIGTVIIIIILGGLLKACGL